MVGEYKRWQLDNILRALKTRRVVAISGARQVGKTTLTRQVITEPRAYRSLERAELLRVAMENPYEFLKNDTGTMVIDEIQKVPALFSEIKLAVDEDNRMGQFLLTGSVNIQTKSIMSDSLAGRIKHIRLRPLTIGEILGKQPMFLHRAFTGDFPLQIRGFDRDKIFELAFYGGYPEILRLEEKNDKAEWYLDYIDSLITKDLTDIENIRRLDVVKDLVRVLAGWSGKYMDKAAIRSTLEVSKATFDSYLNALITLFIFDTVPPYTRTDYELVGRKTKVYASDTGIMTSLLNWQPNDVKLDADRAGKLMETFVYQELVAQIDLERDYSLYQYRDMKKREIDFIIEKTGYGLVGIEVKAGRRIGKEDFKSLCWFKENIVKNSHPFKGIVLYSGEDTLSFGEDMLAVPIANLWW